MNLPNSLFLAILLLCSFHRVESQQWQRGLKHSRYEPNTGRSLEISSNKGKSGTSMVVTTFTDSESLSVCRDSVLSSSEEKGKRFGPQEFANFLDRQSKGFMKDSFDQLQPIFVLVFYTAACISCFAETNDNRCCVDQAHIPLEDEVDSSTFYQILEFLCPNIDQLIADLVVEEPTMPTKAPTNGQPGILSAPSQAPYLLAEPSAKPTTGPSLQHSTAPSQERGRDSNAPSSSSSPSETPSSLPTVKPSTNESDLLCFSFSYTLGNTAGFSAEAILFETNNTIKQGLLAATWNITISILNATMPETQRKNIFDKSSIEGGIRSLKEVLSTRHENKSSVFTSDQVTQWWSRAFYPSVESSSSRQARNARHLAFYTDKHPVRIWNVVDSLFCYDTNNNICVSVFSEVCVVLAPGESSSTVRATLIQGFRSSIESGAFDDAIPPALVP